MELTAFREILLKKADIVGNKNLFSVVKYIDDDFLTDRILETLEKMAHIGTKAPGPLTQFAQLLTESDIDEIRDAVSHHLSHYKAALKAYHNAPKITTSSGKEVDSPEGRRYRQIADQHLERVVPLLHMVARASPNSKKPGDLSPKVELKHVTMHPWESNYTTLRKRPDGLKFQLATKGLGARPSPRARRWSPENPSGTGITDYQYFERPPHPGDKRILQIPDNHNGGYPWESIQIGTPSEVEAGKGYVTVDDDIPAPEKYVPHAFDFHPIMQRAGDNEVFNTPDNHFSDETKANFRDQLLKWNHSEPHEQWLANEEAKEEADPEKYGARGSFKAPHFYEGIPLQPHLDHVHDYPAIDRNSDKTPADVKALLAEISQRSSPTATSAATPVASAQKQITPIVRRPRANPSAPAAAATSATTPTGTTSTPTAPAAAAEQPNPLMEMWYKHYQSLPDGDPMRNAYHKNRDFMSWLSTKKGGNQ